MIQLYVLLGKRLSHDRYIRTRWKKGSVTLPWALHPDAQLRVDALAAVCRIAPVDLVVFSGGQTAGYGLPSEADSLCQTFLNANHGRQCPLMVIEEESLNTIENAIYIKKRIAHLEYFTLHVITSGYHAPRVKEIFLSHDLNVEVLAAEEVIANLMPDRKAEMAAYKKSARVRCEALREWVSRKLPMKFLIMLAHLVRQ